ncbi:MAG: YbjN domain-containing protein [Bowdeniella nasicola]|nr:YbjN domain-containing protein [Bowdeniella nasicola]
MPPALSAQRIVQALQPMSIYWFVDHTSTPGFYWHGAFTTIHCAGENGQILSFQSESSWTAPVSELHAIRDRIEHWHLEHSWPRGFYSITDEGGVRVCADYSVDLSAGVTDEQLTVHVRCAIGTLLDFFAEFRRHPADPPPLGGTT